MTPFGPSFFPLLLILFVVIRRRPAIKLRRRGAISAATAQPLTDASVGDRRRLARLIAQGVVREAAPGTYYYDAAGQRAHFMARLPLILAVLATMVILSIALAYWTARGRGP